MSELRPIDHTRRVLRTAITIALSGCTSLSVEHPGSNREPILCGTLVDADGRALPRYRFDVNILDAHGTSGGATVATDAHGEFRIDSASLTFLWEPSNSLRVLWLIGQNSEVAVCDVSRAFPHGVYHLGQLVMADPCDPRPLAPLSDQELFAALEQAESRHAGRVDVCLRECARRGSPAAVEYLRSRISHGVHGSMIWRTALRRAQRQRDPLTLELPGIAADRPLRTSLGQLPTVDVRFRNRDDQPFTMNFLDDLAIDCLEAPPASNFSLLRRPEGLRRLDLKTLHPGDSLTLTVPIARYFEVLAPGTYVLRFAWRQDASDLVDDQATQLVPGLLFLYSEPFTLVVDAPDGA